ncbi:MAG TPA: hypothetical protein VL443_08240 [Cyclobacteriaceae bacterium]|jgi:hypothetical protein|nr:hypothetical protein [Cyclobacteriaceae bacterium]
MDEMMGDIQAASSSKSIVFGLKKGEKANIRFLSDGQNVLKMVVHGRFVNSDRSKGYTVPCLKLYGHEDCPFCGLEESEENARNTKTNYAFVIWDYRDSKVKLFVFKPNNMSPLEQVGEAFSNYGTLTSRDFVIKRNNKDGFEIRYILTPLDPSSFKKEYAEEVKTQAVMKKTRTEKATGKKTQISVPVDLNDQPSVWTFIKESYATSNCPGVLKNPPEIPPQHLKEITVSSSDPFDDDDDDEETTIDVPDDEDDDSFLPK